jgi:hypothetical protein
MVRRRSLGGEWPLSVKSVWPLRANPQRRWFDDWKTRNVGAGRQQGRWSRRRRNRLRGPDEGLYFSVLVLLGRRCRRWLSIKFEKRDYWV